MSRPEARQLPWCLCHQEVVGVWKATPLQGLEFQKRSKVNLPQALTEEKPERPVGEGQRSFSFCPKNCQELSCKEAAGEEAVQGLRGREASRRGLSLSKSASGALPLQTPAHSPGWVACDSKREAGLSRYSDSLHNRKISITQGPASP